MRVWQVQVGPFLAHEFPVDDHREMYVQDAVVVNGEPQDESDESVLRFILKRGWIKPKEFRIVVVGEHSCSERKEQMSGYIYTLCDIQLLSSQKSDQKTDTTLIFVKCTWN